VFTAVGPTRNREKRIMKHSGVTGLALAGWLAIGGVAAGRLPAADQPIQLDLDVREAARKIYHVQLGMPVNGRAMTLRYPKWVPGEHAPTGPITDVAGLVIRAGGSTIPWTRDDADMYAVHLEVPEGARALGVSFDFITPPASVGGFSSAASATAQLATINWNQVLFYPAGAAPRDTPVNASITLPAGWKLGTALEVAARTGQKFTFAQVSLETLVDSPVIAGAFFKEVRIGPPDGPPHFVEIAADSAAALETSPALTAGWDKLAREAGSLFGARHYESYRFLLALSDGIAHFGLEHHRSSDDRAPERTLIDDDLRRAYATLLCHEFVHSWNGKYRRPADITTSDFQQPMRTGLLWVYEGLTQYLGFQLAARSGLWTAEDYRDKLALIAEWAANEKGRAWRPLVDTTVAAQLLYPARRDWEAWRRSTDFYDEGALIWLDVDTLIREKTAGRNSLEDFCRRFHGGAGSTPAVIPYTFEEVVDSLYAVVAHDWRSFFNERVMAVAPAPPLAGLERAGWRLVGSETPSPVQRAYEKEGDFIDLTASIGLTIEKDGAIRDIIPGKAADRAGVGPGMKLVAVNSRRYSADVLREAVAATRTASGPLELLIENGEYFRTCALEYHEGARYPRLERIPAKRDLLELIIKPAS
jgi:predicted metalloprotease with PDZ domain